MKLWGDNHCLEDDYDSKTKLNIISLSYILHRGGHHQDHIISRFFFIRETVAVSRGGVCSRGVSAPGVSAPGGSVCCGGVCTLGVSAPGGSAPRGCLLQGGYLLQGRSAPGGGVYPSMHWGRPLRVDRHTPVKNITFATSLRTVKKTVNILTLWQWRGYRSPPSDGSCMRRCQPSCSPPALYSDSSVQLVTLPPKYSPRYHCATRELG